MRKTRATLQCGSCRFFAYYFVSFALPLMAQKGSGLLLASGAVYWWCHSLGTELVNRLADREVDVVNRPERTALCEQVGWDRLRAVAVGAWAVVAVIDVAWFVHTPTLALGGMLVAAVLAAVGYSYGPRVKQHAYLSLLELTFTFGGPFLMGWALAGGRDLPGIVVDVLTGPFGVLLFLFLFIVTLSGLKDLTDVEGDRLIGYVGVWVRLVRRSAVAAGLCLLLVPFAVLPLLVATGQLPVRFLALLAFIPVSLAFGVAVQRGDAHEVAAAARELAYHYWLTVLGVTLLLFHPTRAAAAVVVATGAYWIVASRYLHWSVGPRRWHVAAVAGALRGDTLLGGPRWTT